MEFPKKNISSQLFYTVDGFKFSFQKIKTAISDILNPTKHLLIIENGLEEASNSFDSELFFSTKENIENKIAQYNNFLSINLSIKIAQYKYFVNESYFL